MQKRRTDLGYLLPLNIAIYKKDLSNIYEILKQEDIDLNTVFINGNAALHLLFKNFEENNVIEILRAFLRKDINLFHNNEHRETVFHIAVAKRMMKAIDFLLQNGFQVEMLYESNPVTHYFIQNERKRFTALSDSIENEEIKSINFVEWLISKGFDFDRPKRFSKESALHLAIKLNLQHILPTLLKHSNDINHIDEYSKSTLLHSFIEVHNTCNGKTMPSYNNGVRSHAFARRYTTDIIRIMVDKGVDVDAVDRYGNTALHKNVRANIEMGIFEIVLDRFTNVHHKDRHGLTVLHAVTRMLSWPEPKSMIKTYLQIIRSLVAKGSDVNSTDNCSSTPVYEVVRDQNLPAVELMKERADFSKTLYGHTMLHALAMRKYNNTLIVKSQEEIFELLIDGGCDVNALDKVGQSPLHVAIKCGSSAIAKKLIANGANVHCRESRWKRTPLHYAAEKEEVKVAELLLQKGANINGKDPRGARPIDLAADAESSQMLRMLLNRGAYAHTRDNYGKTALSRALSKKRRSNIVELLKYGADINDTCVLSMMDLNYIATVDLILQHWIKLEAANLPCLKEYRPLIEDADYQKFYQECLEEIELLKTTFIDDRATLYSFLQVNPNRRCAYAYCEMLQKYVKCPLFEKQFPKYSVLIQGNYHTAIARKSLVDKAKQVWQEMTEITLPEVCIELILAFIDNADLVNTVGEF